jgi:hypothetical protein
MNITKINIEFINNSIYFKDQDGKSVVIIHQNYQKEGWNITFSGLGELHRLSFERYLIVFNYAKLMLRGLEKIKQDDKLYDLKIEGLVDTYDYSLNRELMEN